MPGKESITPGYEGRDDAISRLQLNLGRLLVAKTSDKPRKPLEPLWLDVNARDGKEAYTITTTTAMSQESYWDFLGLPEGTPEERGAALRAIGRQPSSKNQRSFAAAGHAISLTVACKSGQFKIFTPADMLGLPSAIRDATAAGVDLDRPVIQNDIYRNFITATDDLPSGLQSLATYAAEFRTFNDIVGEI